jgi:hypothetical protein
VARRLAVLGFGLTALGATRAGGDFSAAVLGVARLSAAVATSAARPQLA